jgi:cytoskeleton protein RodZ
VEYLKRNVLIGGGVILAITLLGYAIYSGDEAPVAKQPDMAMMAMESEKDTGQSAVSFPFAPQAPTSEMPEPQAPAPSAFAPDMASPSESDIAALQETTTPPADTGREQDAAASAHKDETAGSGTEASAGEPLTLPPTPPLAPPTPPAASAVPGGESPKVAAAPKPPQVAVTPKPPQVAAAPESPKVTAAPKPPQVAVAPKPPQVTAAPKPPQVAAAPKPNPAAGIRLTFAGESWVQVKDGNGKLLLSRVNPPGSEQVLRGKPPYSLMIGNPGQVKLVYNNSPVDLSTFAKLPGGMAHLVLE